jgi:protein-tyrosine phosphatase
VTQESPHVPSRDTELTGVRNFRDVGGIPTGDGRRVRSGVLFRSGHLAGATADDAAFLSSLGLHTVFDFRNSADIRLDGRDVELAGVRNVNIPLTDPAEGAEFWKMVRRGDLDELASALADGRAAARMVESYRKNVLERTAEHGRVVREVAEGHVPVLLHCAAGKDRAGVAMAVILLALGVERAAVEEDYLKSNDPHKRYQVKPGPGAGSREPEVLALLSPLFEARIEYLTEAFDTIDATWGGVDRYLREGLGLSDEALERLRDRLLED